MTVPVATAEDSDSPVAMKLKKMWLKTPVSEEQAAQAVLDPAIGNYQLTQLCSCLSRWCRRCEIASRQAFASCLDASREIRNENSIFRLSKVQRSLDTDHLIGRSELQALHVDKKFSIHFLHRKEDLHEQKVLHRRNNFCIQKRSPCISCIHPMTWTKRRAFHKNSLNTIMELPFSYHS